MISLIECADDVTYHLKSCQLSRVKVTEYELILARAVSYTHLTLPTKLEV